MKKSLLLLAILGVSTLTFASYTKGFKYYKKYITRKTDLKATQFIKDLNITSNEDVKMYFETNTSKIIQKLNDANETKAAKIFKNKILKSKKKTKDIEDFIKGVLNGKIPASC